MKGDLPPPGTYSRHHRFRRSCFLCFGGCCSLLVTLIILLGFAALVIWLVLRPKSPHYYLQDVQVITFNLQDSSSLSDGSLSSLNSQQHILNADIAYTVEARNPNKKIGILYDEINVYTSYDGDTLGTSHVPAFYQGHKNSTILTSELKAQNVLLPVYVGNSLQSAIANDNVPLYVKVDVKARVKIGSYKSFSFWVHEKCEVKVTTNSGSGVGQLLSKNCG